MKLLTLLLVLSATLQAHAEADLIYPLAQKDGYAYYISPGSDGATTATQICRALGYATMTGFDTAASNTVGAEQIAYPNFIRLASSGGFAEPVKNGPFTGWTLGPGSSSLNVLRDTGISLGGSSSIGYYRNETINLSVISVIACDNKVGARNAMGRAIQLQQQQ